MALRITTFEGCDRAPAMGQVPLFLPTPYSPTGPRWGGTPGAQQNALPGGVPVNQGVTLIPVYLPTPKAEVMNPSTPATVSIAPFFQPAQLAPVAPANPISPGASTVPAYRVPLTNVDSLFSQSRAFSSRGSVPNLPGSPWTNAQTERVPIPNMNPDPILSPVPGGGRSPASVLPASSKGWLLYGALAAVGYYFIAKG